MDDKLQGKLLRGHLDLIVLAALESGAKYGSQLIADVDEQTQGYFQFREGSLYPALHRLEKQGWVSGEFQVLPRGGSPVKFYALTSTGQSELRAKREEFERFTKAISTVLGGAS